MRKSTGNKGFTLLEVLTATAILVMACVLVLKISTQVLESWERTSEGLSKGTEANLALDVMEEDLETAFPHFWVYRGIQEIGVKDGMRLSFYRYGRDGGWYGVVYQVGYDEVKKRYGLYRHVVGVDGDIRQLKGVRERLSPQKVPGKAVTARSNLMAKGVEDFEVKFLYKDKQGNTGWSCDGRDEGLPICAEIRIGTGGKRELTRRVSLIVNSLL